MEKTLDLKVIFCMLRAKWVWIVLTTIVSALCAFCISTFLLTEQFVSTSQVYISNSQNVQSGKTSTSDLTAAKSMADTYCIILESPRATDLLKHKLSENEQFTSSAIQSYSMHISVEDESEVLIIKITSPDPNIAALICNTMVEVASDLISEIFEGGRANPLGEAVPNYTPASPNTRSNMIIGALLGLFVSCALVVLLSLMDNRVKDEADFVSKVGVPVLGEVPSIHEYNPKKENYGSYAYAKKQNN